MHLAPTSLLLFRVLLKSCRLDHVFVKRGQGKNFLCGRECLLATKSIGLMKGAGCANGVFIERVISGQLASSAGGR